MNLSYRIALWCGLTPICTGTLIFLSWLIIRADWLQLAGLFTIYAGLVSFGAGVISLSIYFFKSRARKTENYWKKSIIAIAILLANFPVAATIISAAIYEMSASIVIIENNSDSRIETIYLSGRVSKYEIGSIMPEERIVKKIRFKSEGSIRYNLSINGKNHEGIMFGYVTSGMASSSTMVITKSGHIEIKEKI